MGLVDARTMRGVMELMPSEQIAFQRMLDTIRRVYERFGFLPVETPVMEYTEVLLTKSGGETERQVYFVQSTGALQQEKAEGELPKLALRFDLTVPLARYVAEREKQLTFPFRRYQIQRVYRGESAQRGRFREFYQCDIDVVGKDKLDLAFDAEIPAVIYQLFRELEVGKFTIHINNRRLMMGLFAHLGVADPQQQMLVLREVDKLDKRGPDYVVKTLCADPFGLPEETVSQMMDLIGKRAASSRDCLALLNELGIEEPKFQEGLAELEQVVTMLENLGVPSEYHLINLSIARGLDYYTGTVYETILDDHPEIGSVCSGGRYDNLAQCYTKTHLPGVGISVGATRLFYQLREAGIIGTARSTVQALVTRMDEDLAAEYLKLAAELRAAGINTELLYNKQKFGKQMKYADKAGIRFAVIMGGNEFEQGQVSFKDLQEGDQVTTARADLPAEILKRM